MTAAYDPWGSGLTALPSVEPAQLAAFSGQMSFFERLQNFAMFLLQLQGPYMISDYIQVYQYFNFILPIEIPTTWVLILYLFFTVTPHLKSYIMISLCELSCYKWPKTCPWVSLKKGHFCSIIIILGFKGVCTWERSQNTQTAVRRIRAGFGEPGDNMLWLPTCVSATFQIHCWSQCTHSRAPPTTYWGVCLQCRTWRGSRHIRFH